jgi:hypothetical protein
MQLLPAADTRGVPMTTESASDSSMGQMPLTLTANRTLMRSARFIRLAVAAALVALAVVEPDSFGRALASFAAFLFVFWALIIPRGGEVYVIASDAGLESRYFGLLAWDDIRALHVREKRGLRSLEIFDRDRAATIRRTRPRLLQGWMFATQSCHLPLLRISERMASFDAVQFRAQLELLADRKFPER